MYAAHDDDVGVGRRRFLCQCQAVSHEVGQLLDDTLCIVMCHDEGILFPAHPAYFRFDICFFRDRLVYEALFLPFPVYHFIQL